MPDDPKPAQPKPTPQQAQQMGFTGSFCPTCHGVRIIRTGTCEYCLDCNVSIGGCS